MTSPARIAVFASGGGSNLQALLEPTPSGLARQYEPELVPVTHHVVTAASGSIARVIDRFGWILPRATEKGCNTKPPVPPHTTFQRLADTRLTGNPCLVCFQEYLLRNHIVWSR